MPEASLFPRPVTLRAHLTLLILAALAPLLIFSAILIFIFARQEEFTLTRGLQETTHALNVALDKELGSSITTLEALGSAEALDTGAITEFRRVAWRALRAQEKWAGVSLFDRFGAAVFENRSRGNAEGTADRASIEQILRRPEAVVSNFSGGLDGQVQVFVPVLRENKLIYILSALIDRRAFSEILAGQKLPGDWIGTIFDRNKTVVARTAAPEQTVGKPVAPMLQQPGREDVVTGRTVEGLRAYSAVTTSPRSGWSVALMVPADSVRGPLWRSIAYAIGAGLISLLSGVWLASIFAQRLANPVLALSASAKALGEGRFEPPPAPLPIAELEDVAQDLQRAGQLLRQRALDRDRVEADLRDRDEFLQEQAKLLRESEEKLRRQAVELEQQLLASGRLVAVGELTASMAHEFNNPLGIILGFAQALLSEMDKSDPNFHHVEIIAEEGRRCEKLVQELLEFGRPKRAEFAPADIGPIIEKTLDLISSRAAKNSVQTVARVADDLPAIHADARQMQQLLVNLCFNAIDAMPRGGTLTVGAGPEDSRGIVLAVTDTGLGIEPAMIRKIFQPFVTANKRRGLGLGLPICDSIVKAHGGTIEVESAPGAGTTFTVHLPKENDNDNGELKMEN